MPKLLHARPPRDETEDRQVRKLSTSHHAPADWVWYAKMIVKSWAGARTSTIAPGTLVATPSGERPIATLQVGDAVTAYDPATHIAQAQTVTATFVNHDANLVDVTLRVVASHAAASNTTAGKPASTAPSKNLPTTTKSQQTHDETVQTTTNHPWLTADHSWEPAGFLHVGEPVVEANGSTATVVAVRSVSGAAEMWDLTVANVHTFAVCDGLFVVHNCPDGGNDPGQPKRGGRSTALTPPPLPSGVKNLREFGQLMKWGRGSDEARAAIGTLDRGELISKGMTPELADAWRDFYTDIHAWDPVNPSAAGRIDLMDWTGRFLRGLA